MHHRPGTDDWPVEAVTEPAFIGRPDGPPSVAGVRQGAPRRCHHCGRITTTWTARERDDDRGPLVIVWCVDSSACEAARLDGVRAARIRLSRIRH